MNPKPETKDEKRAYRDAYFKSRAQGTSNDLAKAIAYTAVLEARHNAKTARNRQERVVDSPRDATGRPLCYTVEDWNYGCTPGQFAEAEDKA